MTMMNPLLARFTSTPILLPPEMHARFDACMRALAAEPRLADMLNERASIDDGFWPSPDDWRASYRPYVVIDGILLIPIRGVLLHDFSFATSWATGYAYIWRAFQRGIEDGNVRGIALVCDTPGGEVAGCFDLVDKMVAIRDAKPVRAFAHEGAYSAGYAIASVAKHIAMSRTGGVGSIGVYTMHVDYSRMLDKEGITPTYIAAPKGGHKVDGNPYEPLSADVEARIQARIDELYDVFVSSVARNRGMDEKAIRDTKALTFTASQATSNGLADSIGSLDDAVAAFAVDLSCNEGDESMATNKDEAAELRTAELTAARAEGKAEHEKAGATAERARITGILGHAEAKDRTKSATHLALETDMTVEAASKLLATLPKDTTEATTPGSAFDEAMRKGNPDLGTEDPEKVEGSPADRILAARFGATKAK